jgi:hypothetical protein
MALRIDVTGHSGYKPNERPCTFIVDGELYDIHEVLQCWREQNLTFFKVLTTNAKIFVIRYEHETGEWALRSEYDGEDLIGRPRIELIPVDPKTVYKAERLIRSCERCYPDLADTPFASLLAEVTRKHGKYEFVMAEVARCPICKLPVTERTLVEARE